MGDSLSQRMLQKCLCGAEFCHSNRSSWWTDWRLPGSVSLSIQPHFKGDFRDVMPPTLANVSAQYNSVVRPGEWTHGLFDMWRPKMAPLKHSVHIPCWNSFQYGRVWRWRGVCGGRTLDECLVTGLHQGRIARVAVSTEDTPELTWWLNRCIEVEYFEDESVGTREKVHGLFNLLCCLELATGFGCSFGLAFVVALLGFGHGPNFASPCECHVREKMRRKYNLPPAFGLPPGIDDCLVLFLCSYCASHQMLRELAVRGESGAGLHILDVSPNSFKKAAPSPHTFPVLSAPQVMTIEMKERRAEDGLGPAGPAEAPGGQGLEGAASLSSPAAPAAYSAYVLGPTDGQEEGAERVNEEPMNPYAILPMPEMFSGRRFMQRGSGGGARQPAPGAVHLVPVPTMPMSRPGAGERH